MKDRHLKLIMELIFIFIIPLILICGTSTIEKTYVYDNEGNFESSETELSFDNSIIKYTKTETTTEEEINYYLFQQGQNINTKIYFHEDDFRSNIFTNYLNAEYGDDDGNPNNSDQITLFADDGDLYYLNDYMNIDEILQEVDTKTINNITYRGFNINLNLNLNELEIMENGGYYLLETTETTETTNTIWGNIKELLINNLDLNDSVLLDLIICYTILWFIMFILWHLLYLFFDMLIHIGIDWGHREREKVSK